jgi:hypothetical protein
MSGSEWAGIKSRQGINQEQAENETGAGRGWGQEQAENGSGAGREWLKGVSRKQGTKGALREAGFHSVLRCRAPWLGLAGSMQRLHLISESPHDSLCSHVRPCFDPVSIYTRIRATVA